MSATRDVPDIRILYGSQTGNAEEISRRIHAELPERVGAQLPGGASEWSRVIAEQVRVTVLTEFAQDDALGERAHTYGVFVCSTTGDGDPPDNASKFYRHIKRKVSCAAHYRRLRYAVLALGDTNYENFCRPGKLLDRRLSELGAQRFMERGEADDGTGMEEVVEPWIEKLYSALARELRNEIGTVATAADDGEDGGVADEQAATETETETETEAVRAQLERQRLPHASENGDSAQANGARNGELLSPEDGEAPETKPAPPPPPAAASLAGVPALIAPRLQLLTAAPARAARGVEDDVAASDAPRALKCRVTGARRLTSPGVDAVRRVYHMELQVRGDSGRFAYQPGDAFGIAVRNRADELDALFARLGVDGEQRVYVRRADDPSACIEQADALGHVPRDATTLRELFARRVDLTLGGGGGGGPPKKTLLRALAEHCSDAAERARLLLLSSRTGREQYAATFMSASSSACKTTILTLLDAFPSCKPPPALLLDMLPPLALRYYSASSAPAAHGTDRLHVAFSVVEFADERSGEARRRGLATGMLEDICLDLVAEGGERGSAIEPVELTLQPRQPSGSFAPPPSASGARPPFIMVGPGTGVAPFRGFLHAVPAALLANGALAGEACAAPPPPLPRCWLFCGNRHREHDFLYGDELLELEARARDDVRVTAAFSRDGARKVYVQHLMREHAEDIRRLVQERDAVVYVCGDGLAMERAVRETLTDIVGGKAAMDALTAAGRYRRDIWLP